ncbi:MAG TPA: hypothetical protein VFC44_26235 [Candidatus Saccharimonadales bacterium]|nr:hypothetical protein [Candidatus Saccharimonadales bacterium]
MRVFDFYRIRLLTVVAALGLARADAQTGNRVTINSDNVLVINGRKIFPIGFTMGPPPNGKTPGGKNGLEELAEAGATFIRTGTKGANWNEQTIAGEQIWEDAAARYGLYCWPFLRELAVVTGHDAKREALLRRVVEQFKNHPGLGIWKGADEPAWGKTPVAPLVRAREIVRELDPNHPLAIIQAPRGTVATLRPYNAACDITGADVYPISYPPGTDSLLTNKEISMVGDYTKTMMEVGEGKRPVWMVLQIAWSGAVKPGKTLRFPTFPEERFMSYQAIINGARGLVYFGGNLEQAMPPQDARLGWNWTFWNHVLRPVMEEIGNHSPLEAALVAPDSKLPIKMTGAKDVEYCAREVGTELFILACKREGATVQVRFSGLPVTEGEGEVMYESPRKVEVKNGAFSDWFGPFEVHVYRVGKKG